MGVNQEALLQQMVSLFNSHQQLQEELKRQKEENSLVNERLGSFTKQSEERIRSLEQELRSAQTAFTACQRQKSEAEAMNARYAGELKAIQQQRDSEKTQLEAHSSAARQTVADLQNQLQAQVAEYQREKSVWENDRRASGDAAAALKQRLAEAETRAAWFAKARETDGATAQKTIGELRAEVATLQARLSEAEKLRETDRQSTQRTIDALYSEKQACQDSLDAARANVVAIEAGHASQLADLRRQIGVLEGARESAAEEALRYRAGYEQLPRVQEALGVLEGELVVLRDNARVHDEEVDQLRRERDELTAALAELRLEFDSAAVQAEDELRTASVRIGELSEVCRRAHAMSEELNQSFGGRDSIGFGSSRGGSPHASFVERGGDSEQIRRMERELHERARRIEELEIRCRRDDEKIGELAGDLQAARDWCDQLSAQLRDFQAERRDGGWKRLGERWGRWIWSWMD